jgi:hypothetical protein
MASFTDQIQTFNPYVSQAPLIEAMVTVGTQKQQQYEQGVQKIQGYIDSIAGMDVVTDADKKYLQSKLNELGSRLKTVAAGDFSNQQLVNSVGGMATQVIKDPLVQNAVSSTSWYRKQLADMEKSISEGKSSQANIKDFNDKASVWLSSEKPGQLFRDRYIPYRDINKTAMEAIKALHPSLKNIDIPFEIKDGKINTAVIANAIQRNKIKGITEGQIETAIGAAFTPDDYNQLAIDSRYTFANVAPEALIRDVNENLRSSKRFAEKQIKLINNQLPKYATDPNQTEVLLDRRKYYQDQLGIDGKLGTLDEQATSDIERIKSGDTESAKYSIYKDGFFRQFANAFAYREEELSYEDNPMVQVQIEKDRLALARQTEARLTKQFDIETAQRAKDLELKEQANYLKQVELGLINPNEPIPLGNETDNKLRSGERLNTQIDKTLGDIDANVNALKARGLSDDKIEGMVADYAQNGNKSNVNPAYIPTIQDILKQKKNLEALNKLKDRTLEEAETSVMTDPKNVALAREEANYIAKNFGNTNKITIRGLAKGESQFTNIKISEADLLKLYKQGDVSFKDPTGLQGGSLTINVGGKTYIVESERFGYGSQSFVNEVTKKLKSYYTKFDKPISDLGKQKQDKYLELLAPRVSELVPTVRAIGYGKEEKLPVNLANNLSALITATDAKDIAADNDYDTKTASSFLTKENIADTRVLVQANPDGTYLIQLKNDKDPKNLQNLKVSADRVANTLGPQYLMQNPSEALLLRLGRGTTNINDDPKEAQYQKQFGDFPNVNNYQIVADLDSDAKNPNLFVPKIYVLKKDGTYQPFVIAGRNKAQRLGLEQAKQSFNNMTDEDLIKLLKTEYPNYDFSNLYEK